MKWILSISKQMERNVILSMPLGQKQEQFIAKQFGICGLNHVLTSNGFSKLMEWDMNGPNN